MPPMMVATVMANGYDGCSELLQQRVLLLLLWLAMDCQRIAKFSEE